MRTFDKLIGKTFVSIDTYGNKEHKPRSGDDTMVFTADTGEQWMFYHEQDCCEKVYIEDICGDLADLLHSPLLQVEEATSSKVHEDYELGSETWTFYKFATIKGSVTVRWFGTSNGYYSERVDFKKIRENDNLDGKVVEIDGKKYKLVSM